MTFLDPKLTITASNISLTERKITRFSRFTDGWSYGRGEAFSGQAIENALIIARKFNSYGFLETNALPGESGEIMITAYTKECCCEIIAYANMQYDFILEKNDNEIERKETIDFETLVELILNFKVIATCRPVHLY